jgi:hypothetical protein
MSPCGEAVRGHGPAKLPALTDASSIINEPPGGTINGKASPPAKVFDIVRLDRIACCRFELYHIVAIADEDAGYGDGRASVRRRGTKLLIAALIMHLPAHPAHSVALLGELH